MGFLPYTKEISYENLNLQGSSDEDSGQIAQRFGIA